MKKVWLFLIMFAVIGCTATEHKRCLTGDIAIGTYNGVEAIEAIGCTPADSVLMYPMKGDDFIPIDGYARGYAYPGFNYNGQFPFDGCTIIYPPQNNLPSLIEFCGMTEEQSPFYGAHRLIPNGGTSEGYLVRGQRYHAVEPSFELDDFWVRKIVSN